MVRLDPVADEGPYEALRPEIAKSWQRALACGLRPDTPLDHPEVLPFDRESRLLRAAEPVLTELAAGLVGTRFALMLADREACIVDRRFSDPRLEEDLDGIGAVLGNRFSEENTGTNSIATALELRHGVAVHGPEHFMVPMKRFSCYGQAVLHPVTRKVEAVLQITGPTGEENVLWAPIVDRAARDIAERLLAGSRLQEQRMLVAFQEAAHRDAAVVVLGEDLFLSTPEALSLLDTSDHALLRELAEEAGAGRGHRRDATVASGAEVDVRFRRIPDAPDGVIFEIRSARAERRPVPRGRANRHWSRRMPEELAEYRRRGVPVLIAGEPGSGRSYSADVLAGGEPVVLIDAGTAEDAGLREWLAEVARALATSPGLVVVEGIQLLSAVAAARLAPVLRSSTAWFALTCTPVADLGAEHAALAATCPVHVEIPPLRYRKEELPTLVHAICEEIAPKERVRMTGPVWNALRGYPWPANVDELVSVVRHVLEHRGSDVVSVEDLPPWLRASRTGRRLGPLEQAEYDTITRTLRDNAGNKVHAAQALGISRTTLYKRMRYLGIPR